MLNIAAIQGRLTADPELKTTPNGISVTSFCIANERSFADSDGNRKTNFINVVAWRKTAEFVCKYFGKGDMILIDGSIETRHYLDKYDNKRTAFEIVADSVEFGGSKRTATATAEDIPLPDEPPEDVAAITLDDSDLPF